MVTDVATRSIEIVPFTRQVSRENFDCGNESLDNWLKRFAGQNESRFRSRTFFALDQDSNQLLGYYTSIFTALDAGIQLAGIPVSHYKKPALLIARLAVDQRAQNLGVGKALLRHGLNAAMRASETAGLEIIVVDAIDDEATTFYAKFGFTRFDADSNRMYITMSFLRNL
jgi:GNAT superfamily N-acetyltransferase